MSTRELFPPNRAIVSFRSCGRAGTRERVINSSYLGELAECYFSPPPRSLAGVALLFLLRFCKRTLRVIVAKIATIK